MIPNRYLVKKYLGRLLLGILLLPLSMLLLFLVELQSLQPGILPEGIDSTRVSWGGRILCFFLFMICFRNILSVIKIFMAGIPLSYKDIQRGIWINAWIFTVIFSGAIVSISHAFVHPEISLVLAILSAAFIVGLFIRAKRKRVESKAAQSSVQPHRTKDV